MVEKEEKGVVTEEGEAKDIFVESEKSEEEEEAEK